MIKKRGQEGISSAATLAAILLVVIVVVILILGFTKGFDWVFGWFGVAPGGDLQKLAISCNLMNNQVVGSDINFKIDFCKFVKLNLDKKTHWLNCEDPRIALDKVKIITCNNDELVNKCAQLFDGLSKGKEVYLNNKLIKKDKDGELVTMSDGEDLTIFGYANTKEGCRTPSLFPVPVV